MPDNMVAAGIAVFVLSGVRSQDNSHVSFNIADGDGLSATDAMKRLASMATPITCLTSPSIQGGIVHRCWTSEGLDRMTASEVTRTLREIIDMYFHGEQLVELVNQTGQRRSVRFEELMRFASEFHIVDQSITVREVDKKRFLEFRSDSVLVEKEPDDDED